LFPDTEIPDQRRVTRYASSSLNEETKIGDYTSWWNAGTEQKKDEQKSRTCITMVKLIIEPKKGKDGQIEFAVNYQDPKTDNSFTITITNSFDEAIDRLKTTLEAEVQTMMQKK